MFCFLGISFGKERFYLCLKEDDVILNFIFVLESDGVV